MCGALVRRVLQPLLLVLLVERRYFVVSAAEALMADRDRLHRVRVGRARWGLLLTRHVALLRGVKGPQDGGLGVPIAIHLQAEAVLRRVQLDNGSACHPNCALPALLLVELSASEHAFSLLICRSFVQSDWVSRGE